MESTRPALRLLKINVCKGFWNVHLLDELNARLVYQGLLRCEEILSKQPFIVGDQLTETDIRLFTTVLR